MKTNENQSAKPGVVANVCNWAGKLFRRGVETLRQLPATVKATAVVGAVVAFTTHASAQGTDATVIITAATAAFAAVAALCVSIGTFFAVYKLVKKIK